MAMPATTTLKLPDNLKKRIAPLAESAGKSAHAWMVEAIETQATLAEKRKSFIADARAAEEGVERTGKVYAFDDVHSYMRALARGKKARRPKSVKW
jgi:predicted transcriptional regulator